MWRAAAVTVIVVVAAGCSSDEPSGAPASATIATTIDAPVTTPPMSASTDSSTPSPAPRASPAPTASSPQATEDIVVPDGFGAVAATVTTAGGEVCELCLWLADSSDLRARGLMAVTDLGGAEGMAFVYPGPHTGTFWMKNTVLPLSIAFFADDGRYLDAFDMEPCTVDPCQRYPTARNFVVAIETTQGDLGELGIAPGSRLELSDLPCDPAD